VPFFVRGGTQLARGRGEALSRLTDISLNHLVLVVPPFSIDRKTARLYGMLRAGRFSDGSHTSQLATALQQGAAIVPSMLRNSFDAVAAEAFPEVEHFRAQLADACGHAVLCGAGPSLFAVARDQEHARFAASRLRERGVDAYAVATVPAAESTAYYTVPR
jgi:4-diphosphocytidyl-2-C-methyl-D-erythritol kinase